MQTISFKLEVFEGPMDLLLNLISKHKLNIYDIEISSLLEQYLAYLDQCREQDLELAGEFLEMAARLIYIKTASLLPRPEDAQKEKQALQGALIEYALCKQAAQALAQRFVGGQIFTRPPMQVEVSPAYARTHLPCVLLETWNTMGQKRFAPQENARERLQRVVTRPVVSVMSKVVYVMLGMDNIAYGVERATKDYLTILNQIIEKNPGVQIVVQSVTPMADSSTSYSEKLNNEQINAFNETMKAYCQDNRWYYVNVAEAFKDEKGFLKKEYCSDYGSMGMHLTYEGAKIWVQYLKTHIPQDLL